MSSSIRNPKIGYLAAAVTMLTYSTVTPLGKATLNLGIAPTSAILARYTIVVLILGVLGYRYGALRMDRRGIKFAALAGLCNGAGMLLYFVALSMMNGSIVVLLVSLYPLVVLLYLSTRGERITARSIIRLLLGLVGLYWLLGPGGSFVPLAVVLLMLTMLFYAGYLVIMQWYLSEYTAAPVTFYTMSASAGLALLLWLLNGMPWTEPGLQGWTLIITLAIGGTVVARLALYFAVRNLGSGAVSLLAPFEILLAVIWQVVFLGDRLNSSQWIGAIFVIASGLLAIDRAWKPRGKRPGFDPSNDPSTPHPESGQPSDQAVIESGP